MRAEENCSHSKSMVFLDRDGVINQKLPGDGFVCRWEEFQFLPGSPEAIALLNRFSIPVVLVTNQRGISLGLYSEVDLQSLHARMTSALSTFGARLDAIYYCPHSKNDCRCRKPRTALFEQAFLDFPGSKEDRCVVVGDSLSDMQAAQTLGCKKVLISLEPTTVMEKAAQQGIAIDFCSASLLSAVEEYVLPQCRRNDR